MIDTGGEVLGGLNLLRAENADEVFFRDINLAIFPIVGDFYLHMIPFYGGLTHNYSECAPPLSGHFGKGR